MALIKLLTKNLERESSPEIYTLSFEEKATGCIGSAIITRYNERWTLDVNIGECGELEYEHCHTVNDKKRQSLNDFEALLVRRFHEFQPSE